MNTPPHFFVNHIFHSSIGTTFFMYHLSLLYCYQSIIVGDVLNVSEKHSEWHN
jgi:hypothetical protein